MLEQIKSNPDIKTLCEKLGTGRTVHLGGVWGSAAPLICAAVGELLKRKILFITTHLDDADELCDDLELFSRKKVHLLPAWEIGRNINDISPELLAERSRLCSQLALPPQHRETEINFIVAPVMAMLQPVGDAQALSNEKFHLYHDQEISPEELCGWLVDHGFDRVDQVDQPNDFAQRGGIVDVFPYGCGWAVRFEFFGDQIESIRQFDLDTQRSTKVMDEVDIASADVQSVRDQRHSTLFCDYLDEDTIICMVDPDEIKHLADDMHNRISLMDSNKPENSQIIFAPDKFFSTLEKFTGIEMQPFSLHDDEAINLGIQSLQKLSFNSHEALSELSQTAQVSKVHIYCENQGEKDRLTQIIEQHHKPLKTAVISIGHVRSGFHWPGQKLLVTGHHEIFHRYAKVRKIRRVRTGRPIDSLLDLNEGDYVVHVSHGIAKFEGLRSIKRKDANEEYMRLRFADNAVLHVPVTQINLVQKYIGTSHKRPSLSRLGGGQWARQKNRVMEAVKDLAADMIRTQAMRKAIKGTSYTRQSELQRQFIDEFPYTETEDQLTAMGDIDDDMFDTKPMDRLICGDVGYGKTELAIRAAFKVVEAGKQVAVLVPTTVLADQHYRTFSQRTADYPITVDVISRFRRVSDQTTIKHNLAGGKIDILIGTHRLLSDDIQFADLGLVIIDEEQRFGVEHKEKLKRVRAAVDVLTLSATPIPRTLHMSLLGLRDISALATPPLDRRAIHTEVCGYDDQLIRDSILREMNRGGQVFYVHNRVGNILSVAAHIQKLVPDARIDVGHGQMREHYLEKVMLRFVRGQTDVLICTTIIESGLDIPTANTMIIQDSDRFGLSALHQLRGRVGRYKHKAYCYLLLPQRRTVSPIAAKRLKAIEEFSDLGAGFQIAMRDLELRGAGNILGKQQSGHIASVGYELYCQLLEQTVSEMKGEKRAEISDVHLELGVDAYIPRTYIPSARQRMEVYRKLAACRVPKDISQLGGDLKDAYGPVPPEMDVLLELAHIRVLAGMAGITGIMLLNNDIVFTASNLKKVDRLFTDATGSVRMPDDHTIHWRVPPVYLQIPSLLHVIRNRLARQ